MGILCTGNPLLSHLGYHHPVRKGMILKFWCFTYMLGGTVTPLPVDGCLQAGRTVNPVTTRFTARFIFLTPFLMFCLRYRVWIACAMSQNSVARSVCITFTPREASMHDTHAEATVRAGLVFFRLTNHPLPTTPHSQSPPAKGQRSIPKHKKTRYHSPSTRD